MDFFNVVTVEEASSIIRKNFENYKFDFELIDLLDSTDRILSSDIYSTIDVPEFDRSTVDGYGVVVEDSHGATESIPSILTIIGEVKMGDSTHLEIKSGNAAYVPTGAMLPKGTTGVIMIENAELMDIDTLLLYKPISKGENIIFKGDDTKKGDIALKKGRTITPEVVGVLASLGISRVEVYKKPRFYIISTGDEVIDLDAELTLGKVRDINTYALYSLIQKLGCEVVARKIVADNYELLREEVEKGTALADIVLLSGGSSVGTRDFTDKVISSFDGRGVLVHGLAIKPGKPTIIGEGNGKLIIGLPGHPVSSIVVFKAIVEKYINEKLCNSIIPSQVRAIMDYNFPSSPGKETYHMVTLRTEEERYYASPTFGKSGMITLLSKSQGYIIIKGYEEGINKGEERAVFLL